MIADEDVLEKEDMHIFDRMKEFISQEDVGNLAAAKQLLILIERSVRYSTCTRSQALTGPTERRRTEGPCKHQSRATPSPHPTQEFQEA